MNRPRSFEEVQTYLNQLEGRLAKLETQDIDLHQRKVTNAASATNKTDYTTLNDLLNAISKVSTSSGDFKQSNTIASNFEILKNIPQFKLKVPGSTTWSRFGIATTDTGYISVNLYYDGAAWQVDDVAKIGYMVYVSAGQVAFYNFPVGGALTLAFLVTTTGFGFFGSGAATKQTLNAYTTANRPSAYTSTPAVLASAATLTDLNDLRSAYENLRLSYDDLRTKLKTTTLVG